MSSEPRKPRRKSAEKAEGPLKGAEKEAEKAAKVVKQDVKKVEKAVRKTAKPAAARPGGHVPVAMVSARHGTEMRSRAASGFSLGELAGAGIAPRLAAGWGARVDHRRRSVLDVNVGALKAWHSHPSAAASVRKDVRSGEARMAEVAKEVKAAAEALEEDVEAAEKVVKKEAKKAEKVVKEKAERKPRPKKKADA